MGYVGLPLAIAFSKHYDVIGFDLNDELIHSLKSGVDPSNETPSEVLKQSKIDFTSDYITLSNANFHIVGVPTDINKDKSPNLEPLFSASKNLGKIVKKGDTVVFESTVYPGCTEEDCIPIIEHYSGLKAGVDFNFGYSPERIVPGDKLMTLSKIVKIVSGNSDEVLNDIATVYNTIIEAGVYKAPSIKVAEAAKVIENTQRDLNISLINELALIFDKMGIDTLDVLDAAATKWNFHHYKPGLVGGHCISVDPFYLMHKAKTLGIQPDVIAAGRRVNDHVPEYIAKKVIQTLIEQGKNPGDAKVLVMGVTFKENVSDIRNSKVIDLIKALKEYSVAVSVMDPHASAAKFYSEYHMTLNEESNTLFDIIILAVGHDAFKKWTYIDFKNKSKDEVTLFDLKGVMDGAVYKNYWRL